ncbi:hypothetical protein [uncultured Maribacter sp.]|uniref:hypothetical protein n=1 Tax=uncultured Maribacter sp. TaxID=431308 RepID=UPI002618359A|nr:hypothetical protein [uncultured Maribacter sp.]
MKFETSNSGLIIPYLIIIGISVLSAIYILRHKKEKINVILCWSIGLFLITYFPILEYWSIWTSWSIWPSDFFPESQSVLSDSNGYIFGEYPKLTIIYQALIILSELLLIFSIILFISQINKNLTVKNRIVNWVPFINIFNIGQILYKKSQFNLNFKIITGIWIVFTSLWFYYRFLAGPLYLVKIDSITFIGDILFNSAEESKLIENNLDLGFTFALDILKIIIPVFTFISGLLTLALVKKTCANNT